jgi:hypothetical protein
VNLPFQTLFLSFFRRECSFARGFRHKQDEISPAITELRIDKKVTFEPNDAGYTSSNRENVSGSWAAETSSVY